MHARVRTAESQVSERQARVTAPQSAGEASATIPSLSGAGHSPAPLRDLPFPLLLILLRTAKCLHFSLMEWPCRNWTEVARRPFATGSGREAAAIPESSSAAAAVTAAADRPSGTPPTSRAGSSSMSCGAMPPGFATSHAQASATRPAVPAAPSMNFLLNVSTTSAMSRVPMSALLSWFSECRPAAVAAPSAARRTGAHGCWRD